MPIYFDNAAPTMVCREAADAAYNIMTENYGNPSSTHTMGRNARKALESAREQLARALGAEPAEVFFTSCGTESDNWAILSGAELMKRRGNHVISSTVEHSAVLKALDALEAQGWEVTRLSPEKDGSISAQSVLDALRPDTVLISLMMVNNETGGITDISAISKAVRRAGSGALIHCDAVQGFMKLPFKASTLGADMISVSGHKIHAPKGIGALYIKGGEKAIKLKPLIVGGSQESARRAGTEALPQIAAFGAAAELAKAKLDESQEHMKMLKARAIERLCSENEGLLVLSGDAPHILSISLPGYKSEVLMNFLEKRDIFVSKSSACRKGKRSYVLEALGLSPDVIDGALRIGFSRYNTLEELDALCNGISDAKASLKTVLGHK